MELNKTIAIANDAYPDDMIQQAHEWQKEGGTASGIGDGLAWFIANELTETYDPDGTDETQLEEAFRVMNTAYDELGGVLNALAVAKPEAQA